MINRVWTKPLEAEGDMQTLNDAFRPEELCRNRIASYANEEGIAMEDEEEEDNDNEY